MYPWLFRHFLSKMGPETAHHAAMIVIRVLGVAPLSWIARALTRPDPSLRVHTMGLTFDAPFGVAAGFDKDAEAVNGLHALGFGHVEVGTLTAIPQEGNPKPRLFRLIPDRGVINRMGFNNHGSYAAAARLERARRRSSRTVLGVNIGKSRIVDVDNAVVDYVTSTRLLAPVADYLVVNVSSPNTPGLRSLQAVDALRPLLTAVQDAAEDTPLLVKIAPDLADEEIQQIAALAVELGLQGIVAVNTTIARDGLHLVTDPAVVAAAGAGGLSGKPLEPRAMEVLALVRAAVPEDFCIIAAGGVETSEDVQRRLDAGATLVQGYTGFLYRGPLWARQINRGLRAR